MHSKAAADAAAAHGHQNFYSRLLGSSYTAPPPKRDIIKGLYVCGNVQGSRYAVEYPICMRGISHSLCVYYGYIAGKNCVAGV